MTPTVLQERLMARAKAKSFGHFYLFTGRPSDRSEQIKWANSLIRRYWTEVEGRQTLPSEIRDDADLLWITPPRNDDGEMLDYKIEHIEDPLSTFLPYRGLKSQRRFVVIEEAHLLTTVISNKLLKTLEEPIGDLSFFWLNPTGKKMLPTIESRALNLKLSWPLKTESPGPLLAPFLPKFTDSDYPLADFLEETKKSSFDATQLLDELLAYEQVSPGPVTYQQDLLNLTKDWDEAERFNQSIGPRLQGIHLLLSQRFRSGR